MKDDTIGPVITWTTEAMLGHKDKLLKIPGMSLHPCWLVIMAMLLLVSHGGNAIAQWWLVVAMPYVVSHGINAVVDLPAPCQPWIHCFGCNALLATTNEKPKEGQQALSGQTCITQVSVAADAGLLLVVWWSSLAADSQKIDFCFASAKTQVWQVVSVHKHSFQIEPSHHCAEPTCLKSQQNTEKKRHTP